MMAPQIIGITGGIACGKTTVGQYLMEMGIPVCETDRVAHELMQPDGAAYEGVVTHFGEAICRADGTIDRRLLAERVFGDDRERAELNKLVHPHVRHAWRTWAADLQARGLTVAVVIPLLYEVGAEKDVDMVICVAAPMDAVKARLQQRGLNTAQAEQRLAAQWPLAEKRRLADFVIENTGSEADLRAQVRAEYPRWVSKEKEDHGGRTTTT